MSDAPTRDPQARPTTDPVTAAPAGGVRDPATPNVISLVIGREIRMRLRSTAFILSTVFSILLLVGVIVLPQLFAGPTDYTIAVVGDGNDAVLDSATALANDDAEYGTTIAAESFDDVAAAERAVRAGEVDAALIDAAELVIPSTGGFGGSGLPSLLQEAAATTELEQLVGGDRADRVIDTLTTDSLTVRSLAGPDADENEGRGWLAYGGVFLTYITILSYGAWTLTGVTEEKANRVIELLLATARPWQLLTGKIVGISALGLAQFALTVGAALVAIRVTGAFGLPAIPVDIALVLLLWNVLGFGLYMVLFGSAGALASKMEDAQTASTPLSIVAIVSLFLGFQVLDDPAGTIAVVATFVPFAAPFIVPIRFAFDAVPVWQHLVSVVLMLVTIAAVVRLGARVYSGAVLRFGGRVGWREALRSERP